MSGENAEGMLVEPRRAGLFRPVKADFPVRYGEFSRLSSPALTMDFDRNGRIRYLEGRGDSWPHPLEYLKRTDGNDWVYYSMGEYGGFLDLYGEYYLPCPSYPTNRPLGGEPFRHEGARRALSAWPEICESLYRSRERLEPEARAFAERARNSSPHALEKHARQLHGIIGTPVPVLPPDARHVDYDVVPLVLVDGCTYRCRFCVTGSETELAPRTRAHVAEQIELLQEWLGLQRGNYQGLFLGLHDALSAEDDLILWSMEQAYRRLGFEASPFCAPHLFMFGSVDSLLAKTPSFFDALSGQPWSVFINVGLESAHRPTLEKLGKPLTVLQVDAAFQRAMEVNATWMNVEVSSNFVLIPDADGEGEDSMIELVNRHVARPSIRGACYLSPLMEGDRRPVMPRRELRERIYNMQRRLPLPLFVYLIQRL